MFSFAVSIIMWCGLALFGLSNVLGADRPNFLMISCEDTTPWLGYHGEKYATTPHIDEMARNGISYNNSYATAPVCSPCRFAIITGRYATSYGTQRLRSTFAVPRSVEGFPTALRRAGYYCTNNAKTDYNTKDERRIIIESWDECSPKAHWKGRQPGQPFFAVFNLEETHQSAAFKNTPPDNPNRHDPTKASIPPYYPDTPEARRTMARIHDNITAMDTHVGQILAGLKADGLEDETIVIFWADHGQGIPRHKRTLWDTGLKVPLVVRFPAKFRHLAPGEPGESSDRLVLLMDLGPTLLSLAGLPIPDGLHGKAFLGKAATAPREYVYGARDRVDEAIELCRSVRDKRYLYIKNYMPHISWMAPEGFSDQLPLRREIAQLAAEGKLNAAQRTFAAPSKPVEELYDTQKDSWQIHNIATDPAMKPILERMREELRRWQIETRDLGFLHEGQASSLCEGGKILSEVAASNEVYPLERILKVADMVGLPGQAAKFAESLSDADPTVRYWGAVGLKAAGSETEPYKETLQQALEGASWPAQVEMAGILFDLFDDPNAHNLLSQWIEGTDSNAALYAARTVQLLGEKSRPFIPTMRRVLEKKPPMFIAFALKAALQSLEKDNR